MEHGLLACERRAIVLAMSLLVLVDRHREAACARPGDSGRRHAGRSDGPGGSAAPAGRVDAGAAIYRKVGCFQCHVNEAQGGANGPRLGPDPMPFARFTQYVRRPTGDMPPYTRESAVGAGYGRHLRLPACATTAAGSQRDPAARAVEGVWGVRLWALGARPRPRRLRLRQGYGGPPKLHAKAEACALHSRFPRAVCVSP